MSPVRGAVPAAESFVKASASDDKSTLDAKPSDPPTLEAIYAERARFVWLTLQRLGVRRADLDDVCQDVFVTLQRKLPEFDQRNKIQPWLFAICAHTASNYRRLARFRLEVTTGRMSADDELNPAAPAYRRPDQEASDREQIAKAEAVLARMSPLKRTVFVMFELEGLSCQEIADELGLPVGTVYSRLHAARKLFLAHAAKQAGK